MDFVADILGCSAAGLRLIVSLLIGYPLAIAHKRWIRAEPERNQHLYFFLTGFALLIWNFGWDCTHSLVNIAISFIVMLIAGRTQIGLAINFVFCVTYLMLGYYYTATENYDIKWTMPHCILCLRLIGVAFDYYDGGSTKPNDDKNSTVLVEMPSLLEILGHTYFFGACLVGPQFPMRKYQDFIADRIIPDHHKNADSSGYAINRLLFGIGAVAFYQTCVSFINDAHLLSDDYLQSSFIKQWTFLGLYSTVTLHKYIACWLLAEGSCALTGLTYREEESEPRWDGLKNIALWNLETTTTFDGIIRSFNINTNKWVAQYIFKRLRFLGNKDFSQFVTLVFLALWHGLHIGYYMCFLMEFLVMKFERDFTTVVQMIPALHDIVYSPQLHWQRLVFQKIHVATLLGYCLAPFTLLTWSRFHIVYASVYYLPTLLLLVWSCVSFRAMPTLRKATEKYRMKKTE